MSRSRKSGGGGVTRLAAFLAAVVFHAVLLFFLVRYLPAAPTYREPPSIQASLVPPPRSERDAARDAAAARPHDPDASARTRPAPDVQPMAPLPPNSGVAPFTTSATPGEAGVGAKGLQALRGLRGCDLARLTPEERARCETERWARVPPVTARLNLDPTGRYAKNPEPFLSRRPTDGCRARLTGDVDPMGNDMAGRAGITCVIPF